MMMIATEATGQSGRAQWYLCRRFCEDAWVIGQLQMRGTTPDLGFLVTGPGFEPGKTVAAVSQTPGVTACASVIAKHCSGKYWT